MNQTKLYSFIRDEREIMDICLTSNKTNNTNKTECLLRVLYFGIFLMIGLSMVFKQPFGNPPDEYNRYLIPQYICRYGTLPNGFDEEIRISGYGFSYGFQPILPYMLQGYTMRLVSVFNDSENVLLYTARLVDLFLGLLMAYVVLLLGKKWFKDPKISWFFCFLVTFLPQSIFVHTYVNTDSCCMLSIAVIIYAMTLGLEDDFSLRSSLLLAVGIILCALSYYNAYAYILSSILLFTAHFFGIRSDAGQKKLSFDFRKFIKKGLTIAIPVLAGISWWFIRSAILYDGDFLGLKTRNYCGTLYAIPEYDPTIMSTYLSEGHSVWYMLAKSDFLTLTILSFIGIYGPMTIVSTIWLYRFYKFLFFTGILLELISIPFTLNMRKKTGHGFAFRLFTHLNMLFCIIMPLALSIWYSYATDYQPQGRYVLPALIPVCYYCTAGFEKLSKYIKTKIPASGNRGKNLPTNPITGNQLISRFFILAIILIVVLLFVTVYGYAFPYYNANPVAP